MIGESRPTSKRWIERAKNAALLGAVAAAISGYAFAISPTVDTGREFSGAVTFFNAGLGGTHAVYTVPAGQQYTLTDIVVSNSSTTTPSHITVAVGNASCEVTSGRTHAIVVPRESTLHLPFVTGIGVGTGKTVCVTIAPVSMPLTLRGYLSNGT